MTVEQVLDGSHDSEAFWIYGAVKTIAEQELWKFADEHPEIDVTTSAFSRALRDVAFQTTNNLTTFVFDSTAAINLWPHPARDQDRRQTVAQRLLIHREDVLQKYSS